MNGAQRVVVNRVDLQIVNDGLVTIEEAMQFLAVSRATVYSIMDDGALPYVKVRRCRRIPRKALVGYAASHVAGGWAS